MPVMCCVEISRAAWGTRTGRCTWRLPTQPQHRLWQALWLTLGIMEHRILGHTFKRAAC